MMLPDTLLQSKVHLSGFLSSILDRRDVRQEPYRASRPDAPMVMDLVPAGSDSTLDVLIGCLGAMSVMQARTIELAGQVEDHLAASAREWRDLRADIETLKQRALTPPPPREEPRPRVAPADAAPIKALHQRLQAVEAGIGQIVRQMIASYVVAEPDFGERRELPGDGPIAGVQARFTAATAAAAQHRAHIATLRAALSTAGGEVKPAQRAAGLIVAA